MSLSPAQVENLCHHGFTPSRCKTYFSVILNEVKDLELVENTRFFAALRITRHLYLGFCNSLSYRIVSQEYLAKKSCCALQTENQPRTEGQPSLAATTGGHGGPPHPSSAWVPPCQLVSRASWINSSCPASAASPGQASLAASNSSACCKSAAR